MAFADRGGLKVLVSELPLSTRIHSPWPIPSGDSLLQELGVKLRQWGLMTTSCSRRARTSPPWSSRCYQLSHTVSRRATYFVCFFRCLRWAWISLSTLRTSYVFPSHTSTDNRDTIVIFFHLKTSHVFYYCIKCSALCMCTAIMTVYTDCLYSSSPNLILSTACR